MNKKPNHRDQGKFEFPGCLGVCGSKLNFNSFIQEEWSPDDEKITLAFKEMMNMNFILCKKIYSFKSQTYHDITKKEARGNKIINCFYLLNYNYWFPVIGTMWDSTQFPRKVIVEYNLS